MSLQWDFAVLAVVLINGSLELDTIVKIRQDGTGTLSFQPVGFIIFITAALAETNRHPFDFAEAEQELVAGYHTEYSSMKFALFFPCRVCKRYSYVGSYYYAVDGGWQFRLFTRWGFHQQ